MTRNLKIEKAKNSDYSALVDPRKIDPILLTQPDNHYWAIGDIVGAAFEVGKKLKK